MPHSTGQPILSLLLTVPLPFPRQRVSQSSLGHTHLHPTIQFWSPYSSLKLYPWHSAEQSLLKQSHWQMGQPCMSFASFIGAFPLALHWLSQTLAWNTGQVHWQSKQSYLLVAPGSMIIPRSLHCVMQLVLLNSPQWQLQRKLSWHAKSVKSSPTRFVDAHCLEQVSSVYPTQMSGMKL